MTEITFLPGLEDRPWLAERDRYGPRFGHESRNASGRVLVTLGARHRFANSAGWSYRYRLVCAYALEARDIDAVSLLEGEHVDHINGVIDDDRVENLRLVSPDLHGRYHAELFEIAGCRDEQGRFRPLDVPQAIHAHRAGPVISSRRVDPRSWKPLTQTLISESRSR